jgi:hypothetical protein
LVKARDGVKIMLRLSLILALGGATAAQAMLSPCSYDTLMREAVHVVQGAVTFAGPPDANGICPLTIRVATIARGTLTEGEDLTVAVPCTNPEMMVGGTLYTSPEALAAAQAVELHLTAGLGLAAYGAGIILIPAVTGKMAWMPLCG